MTSAFVKLSAEPGFQSNSVDKISAMVLRSRMAWLLNGNWAELAQCKEKVIQSVFSDPYPAYILHQLLR